MMFVCPFFFTVCVLFPERQIIGCCVSVDFSYQYVIGYKDTTMTLYVFVHDVFAKGRGVYCTHMADIIFPAGRNV